MNSLDADRRYFVRNLYLRSDFNQNTPTFFVGSWVKLDASFKNGSDHPVSAHNGEMEDLLAEAVDESKAVGTSSDKEG